MFTKQHYEIVAQILHRARRDIGQYDPSAEDAIQAITGSFGAWFANDNERFDRERFYRAVETGEGIRKAIKERF